jgi:hypothetical protein
VNPPHASSPEAPTQDYAGRAPRAGAGRILRDEGEAEMTIKELKKRLKEAVALENEAYRGVQKAGRIHAQAAEKVDAITVALAMEELKRDNVK